MVEEYKHYIGGNWIKGSSGETFESRNPANKKEVIGIFQKGNAEDVRAAVDAAKEAFKKWASIPAPERGEILLKAAGLLRARKEELGKLVSLEMGKVIAEGMSDVQETIDTAEYFAGEGRRLFGYTTPSELPDKFAMTIRRPVGVCGLITPWNFPIAIPAWKIMPGLICGNTVVFKPAEDTPLCAVEFVKILENAGVPKGVVNMVTGYGEPAGAALVKHKEVPMISFTGSREVGELITKNAGIKKIGLELGGKNGCLIMDDANLDLAVQGVIWGAFGTSGQRCTATSRVIVHKKVATKFEKMFVDATKKLKLGNPLQKTTDVGPLINQEALEKVENYINIGKEEGAKLVCGGKKGNSKGYFFQPTVFVKATSDMAISQEEIFGPTVSLIEVNNLEEGIEVMNSISYGLSSSIYTNNVRNAFLAMEWMEAGLTYVNSSNIGSEVHLPFGGVKQTGNGTREAGIEGIHEFSETKTVYVDYSGKLQKAQMD